MSYPKSGYKKKSERRKEQQREYSERRKLFLNQKENRWCRVRTTWGCSVHANLSTDVHHRMGREGELLLDESKWLACCRNCHDWIESNREDAYARGLLLKRN